jgi:hypothetical protein
MAYVPPHRRISDATGKPSQGVKAQFVAPPPASGRGSVPRSQSLPYRGAEFTDLRLTSFLPQTKTMVICQFMKVLMPLFIPISNLSILSLSFLVVASAMTFLFQLPNWDSNPRQTYNSSHFLIF